MSRELWGQTMATELTDREQKAIEHLRKAAELEVSMAEYCRSFDVDVKDLYSAKQSIAKKGLLPPSAGPVDVLSDFVQVTVAPTAPDPSNPDPEPVCRIRCPNGVLIECLRWPAPQWIARIGA